MKVMCFVTRLHALAKQGEAYRVGKAVHLCRVIKIYLNSRVHGIGQGDVLASHRLDSRRVFLGWV